MGILSYAKYNKIVLLSITFSNILKILGFIFFVAHNKKNFALGRCILVKYINGKVQNCFKFFKRILCMISEIFNIERPLELTCQNNIFVTHIINLLVLASFFLLLGGMLL
jgi:hypothetical protein